jgi:ABC-2 type transport system permease protein
MFSKTIFKQTLKQNWKLWAIFTALTSVMSAVIIAVFDPRIIQRMVDMVADMPGVSDRMGEMMSREFSLLGMLSNSFYGMNGILLPLVFIIMTANSLIASQVDRGSMAYTLSTPIKRIKVVSTQALYMIVSVFSLYLVVTLIGLGTVQLVHNGLWGEPHTPDVIAAANVLNMNREDVSNDLNLILNNPEAIREGAHARRVDEDVYIAYLNIKIMNNAIDAAAQVMGISSDELIENPALLSGNDAAIKAAAAVMGVEASEFAVMLENELSQQSGDSAAQTQEMQGRLMAGLTAAADVLEADVAELATQMGRIKNNHNALVAMVSASGMPEEMIIGIINQQLATVELEFDRGIDFNIKDYINLNFGIFLLMFAIAGISFMFSCIFNLTKHSLALGAGIPIACLILQIMSQASSDLENLRYLSINTLFEPSAIIGGGTFMPQFIALAVMGIIMYFIGIKVFKEKDLPL